VPDYAIVSGNRAEIEKMRFDDAATARLNAVAWWAWPIETVLENEDAIVGADIDAPEGLDVGELDTSTLCSADSVRLSRS
jgi:virginiamycin A acetyltransferase